MSGGRSEPAFDGAPELLEWLYALDRRPWWITHESLLPIVHLHVGSSPGESRKLLAALRLHWTAHRLRGARKCAMLTPPDTMAVDGVEHLLASAAFQFFQRKGRGRGRGAPRFAFALWLVSLRGEGRDGSPPPEDEVYRQVRAHFSNYPLFDEEGAQATDGTGSRVPLTAISDLPWWIKLLAWVLPRMVLQVTDTLFGPQRWFEHRGESRHQRSYPDGQEPLKGSLFTLAKRFSGAEGQPPTQQQVDALLVDALLEDLRRAYSRCGIFGRGRRRRTYPVLLLECERNEATTRLLRAIKDVRNGRPRRGKFKRDPLLVVAADPHPASSIDSDAREEAQPGSPETAYAEWRADLEDSAVQSRVWLLPFTIPTTLPQAVRDRVRRTRPPQWVPWMSFVGLALLIAGSLAVPISSREFCRPWWSPSVRVRDPGVIDDMALKELGNGRKQCVGLISEERLQDFVELLEDPKDSEGSNDHPIEVIKSNNEKIEKNPKHITVAYLGILSPDDEQGKKVTIEELRGLAVAQKKTIGDKRPIRLRLANAGADMEYAVYAANQIAEEATREKEIVGVVGMGLSTKHTASAISRLEEESKLPSVGSATTAGKLVESSKYYFQISPSNKNQASAVANFATNDLSAENALVYYSGDKDDVYSDELNKEISRNLKKMKVVREYGYETNGSPGEDMTNLGSKACKERKDYIVVYAGRGSQFKELLEAIKASCSNDFESGKNKIRMLATDDVSRYILENDFSEFYEYIDLHYVSLVGSVSQRDKCDKSSKETFYKKYEDLFRISCSDNNDGRAMLMNDALMLIRAVVKRIDSPEDGTSNIEPSDVVLGLYKVNKTEKFSGLTGDVCYLDGKRVPESKKISIMRVAEDKKSIEMASEVDGSQSKNSDSGCGAEDT